MAIDTDSEWKQDEPATVCPFLNTLSLTLFRFERSPIALSSSNMAVSNLTPSECWGSVTVWFHVVFGLTACRECFVWRDRSVSIVNCVENVDEFQDESPSWRHSVSSTQCSLNSMISVLSAFQSQTQHSDDGEQCIVYGYNSSYISMDTEWTIPVVSSGRSRPGPHSGSRHSSQWIQTDPSTQCMPDTPSDQKCRGTRP